MSGESDLREKAREAIRAGKLPNVPPESMWGGRGDGSPCAICDQPIRPDEVEFELEFPGGADDSPGQVDHARENGHQPPANPHVHIGCFTAWELERQQSAAMSGAAPSGRSGLAVSLPEVQDNGIIEPNERESTNGGARPR